jgi:glycosyltransferase involved in cell wall biosynthesis
MSPSRETPRISILLPVWNAETTLSACLRSLVRQTESNWECILIDDGSSDRSLTIAREFAARDPRFRLEARPHEGLIATLNTGIPLCSAAIVARMDADDWMHRDRLRLQCAALDDNPDLDALGCFTRSFPRRELPNGRRRYEAWLHSLEDAESVWRDRFIECPIAHPTLVIRHASLLELGYRDRGWPEDWDLLLRLLRNGPRVGVVARRLLGWRDRPDRLSRNDTRYALERFTACRAWHLHRDFLSGNPSYILWGHGRTGRALRKALADLGHQPAAIVEVHPRRIGETIGGAPVIPPSALAAQPPYPVVVSVAGTGPRSEIRSVLTEMKFREGIQFVCAA